MARPVKLPLLSLLALSLAQVYGADVAFRFQSSDTTPQGLRSVSVYPSGTFTNGAGAIITRDRVSRTTDSIGSVTVSNVYGGDYRAELQGTFTTTTNWYHFPVTNGLINAADYLTAPTNGNNGYRAYTTAESDARYASAASTNALVQKAGDRMTGPLTNTSGVWLPGDAGQQNELSAFSGPGLVGFSFSFTNPASGNLLVDAMDLNNSGLTLNLGAFAGNGTNITAIRGTNVNTVYRNGLAATTNAATGQVTVDDTAAPTFNQNQFGVGGGTNLKSGALLTNTVTFGPTNYFSTDGPANTNGPIMMYRQVGSGNLTNLIQDIVIGPQARFAWNFSSTPGDAAYGQWFVNTTHGGTTPSGQNTEFQMASPGNFAFGLGFGNFGNGWIQKGIGSSGGYGGNNYFEYWQEAVSLSQSSPTGFSGGSFFKTGEQQGAGQGLHYPGLYAYSTRTNAPGRWILAITSEQGSGGLAGWDPNTAKPGEWINFVAGDTNVTAIKGLFSSTNNTVSQATIWDVPSDGSVFNTRAQLNQYGSANLGFNAGGSASEVTVFQNVHQVWFNNGGSGTAVLIKNGSAQTSILLDPANITGNGGNWINPNLKVGALSAPAQTFDVIGKSAYSDTAFYTNGLSTIGGRGIEIATNALANWPTAPLTRGGCALVNSNSFVYLLQSDPNGTTWTSTNKIGK